MGHPLDREYLREAAKAVEAKFPDNHGFILLVTPFGEARTRYISNCQRQEAIKILKTFFFQIGDEENWMKHIK